MALIEMSNKGRYGNLEELGPLNLFLIIYAAETYKPEYREDIIGSEFSNLIYHLSLGYQTQWYEP